MIRSKVISGNGIIQLDAGYQILNVLIKEGYLYVVYNADYESPINVHVELLSVGDTPSLDYEYVGTFTIVHGRAYYVYVKDCDLQDQATSTNPCA